MLSNSDDDDGFGKRGKKGAEAEAAKLMRTRGELGLEVSHRLCGC